MAKEKDITERTLEDYNDVFADIVNTVLFKADVVKPEDLYDTGIKSQLKTANAITEQERDTAKLWKNGTITLSLLGLENQTKIDSSMPLRVFSYDGAAYKEQVNRQISAQRSHNPVTPFYPSVTAVLYFGQTPWNGPRTLEGCFADVPEALRPFIPDYRVPVIEVAFLSPEVVASFRSDFRYVADYLTQLRTTEEYDPPPGRIGHPDETLKLMGAITGDSVFQDMVNSLPQEKKEELTMRTFYEFAHDPRVEERDRKIAEYARTLAENKRSMAEYERRLADKDCRLAEYEREIAELKQRLGSV